MRFGMGFIAPFGRSLGPRYMFIGEVIMWRSFVVGRITRNAMNDEKWTTHMVRCRSDSVPWDQFDHRADSPHPTNDHCSNWGRFSRAIRNPSTRKPVTPMTRNVARMTASSGLVLMRIRYGRWRYRRPIAQRIPTRKMMPNRFAVAL